MWEKKREISVTKLWTRKDLPRALKQHGGVSLVWEGVSINNKPCCSLTYEKAEFFTAKNGRNSWQTSPTSTTWICIKPACLITIAPFVSSRPPSSSFLLHCLSAILNFIIFLTLWETNSEGEQSEKQSKFMTAGCFNLLLLHIGIKGSILHHSYNIFHFW